jgi:hypothetical protein
MGTWAHAAGRSSRRVRHHVRASEGIRGLSAAHRLCLVTLLLGFASGAAFALVGLAFTVIGLIIVYSVTQASC